MRFDITGDSYGVETSKRDVEFARQLAETVEPLRDLASYAVGEVKGQCQNCGKSRPTRPLGLQGEDGNPRAAPVCAPCQKALVEERVEMHKARLAEQQAMAEARDSDGDEDA